VCPRQNRSGGAGLRWSDLVAVFVGYLVAFLVAGLALGGNGGRALGFGNGTHLSHFDINGLWCGIRPTTRHSHQNGGGSSFALCRSG